MVAEAKEKSIAYHSKKNMGNKHALKPPSDDKKVMYKRARSKRYYENLKRKLEGRSPLKPGCLIAPSRTARIDKIDQAMSLGHPSGYEAAQEVLLDEWGHADEDLLPKLWHFGR